MGLGDNVGLGVCSGLGDIFISSYCDDGLYVTIELGDDIVSFVEFKVSIFFFTSSLILLYISLNIHMRLLEIYKGLLQ